MTNALTSFSAHYRQQGERIAAAVEAGMVEVATAVAAGQTPGDLPSVGTSAAAHRRLISARAIARRGITPATAQTVWDLYSAALWADENAEQNTETERHHLTATEPQRALWPARGPRLVVSCTRPARGLSARWASHAPPAYRSTHRSSVIGGDHPN